jgi:hypothetical protein
VLLKGKGSYTEAGKTQKFNYRIEVENEKIIWFSLSLLGIEGARGAITPDSVIVIQKLDRSYYAEPYAYLEQLTGLKLPFALFEQVFFGQAELAKNAQVVENQENLNKRLYKTDLSGQAFELEFDPTLAKLERIVLVDKPELANSWIKYSQYQVVGNRVLPYLVQMELGGKNPIRLELQHTEVLLNPTDLRYTIRIPSGYEHKRP